MWDFLSFLMLSFFFFFFLALSRGSPPFYSTPCEHTSSTTGSDVMA